MSERIDLNDILRENGVPVVKLDVTASERECHKLREKLMALTHDKQQGYLEVDCSFFIDIHDIDRYLTGELPNLAEIYAFADDVHIYDEDADK